MNLKLTEKEGGGAFVWERVKQNGGKEEKQYVFKVLLFPFSAEAETAKARNKESALVDSREKVEKGLVLEGVLALKEH